MKCQDGDVRFMGKPQEEFQIKFEVSIIPTIIQKPIQWVKDERKVIMKFLWNMSPIIVMNESC